MSEINYNMPSDIDLAVEKEQRIGQGRLWATRVNCGVTEPKALLDDEIKMMAEAASHVPEANLSRITELEKRIDELERAAESFRVRHIEEVNGLKSWGESALNELNSYRSKNIDLSESNAALIRTIRMLCK
jgi:hypothetical protein